MWGRGLKFDDFPRKLLKRGKVMLFVAIGCASESYIHNRVGITKSWNVSYYEGMNEGGRNINES